MSRTEDILYLARKFLFVRETKPNHGHWVELFQLHAGGQPGDSWCAAFVSFILAVAYGGYMKAPLPRTMSCDVLLDAGRAAGWLSSVPEVGDVFLYLHNPVDAHHTGLITEVKDDGTVIGIAGNTSSDGKSSNGDGVYEHAIDTSKIIYVRYPR